MRELTEARGKKNLKGLKVTGCSPPIGLNSTLLINQTRKGYWVEFTEMSCLRVRNN